MLDDNNALSQAQWEQIVQIWEEYQINSNLEIQSTNIKSQAIQFLANKKQKLTRSDIRRFHAKIDKLKISKNKSEKIRGHKLYNELRQVINGRVHGT